MMYIVLFMFMISVRALSNDVAAACSYQWRLKISASVTARRMRRMPTFVAAFYFFVCENNDVTWHQAGENDEIIVSK